MESSAARSAGTGFPRWLFVWGPAVLQMMVIFAASSLPNVERLPGGVSDKFGHFVGYGILGVLMIRGVSRARWSGVNARAGLYAWTAAAAYGVSDEVHQLFVTNRSASLADWTADALGAAAGVAAVVLAAVLRPGRGRAV